MSQIASVAIVGGGPCGLLAALLLARSGVQCDVFEKKSGISGHPKAMGISPRTSELLQQIGLYPQFQAASLPLEGRSLVVWAKSLVGEELGRSPIQDYHSPFSPVTTLHCPQTETERILLDALREEPLATLHFDREVVDVHFSSQGGELEFAAGSPRVFSWLIAADGAGSRLRRKLQIGTTGPGDMGHFLNVMFRADYGRHLQNRPSVMYSCLWEEGFETFVSVNGHDKWLMHHFLQPGEQSSDYPTSKLLDLILAASGLPDVPVEILGVSPWVMSPKLAMEFRKDRFFLIGDAAARLSPAGGLGLNTGLQSTHNLAWKLAAVIKGQAGVDLLDSYDQERNNLSGRIMRATNQNASEVLAIVNAGISGHWDEVRNLIQHSRRNGSGLGLNFGFQYESNAIVPDGTPPLEVNDPVNDYVPSARPGRRAPHLLVEKNGQTISLLEFFRNDFVLLLAGGDNVWTKQDSPVSVYCEGRDFVCPEFASLYGLDPGGAVLVRPDGVVGARWPAPPAHPHQALDSALHRILSR